MSKIEMSAQPILLPEMRGDFQTLQLHIIHGSALEFVLVASGVDPELAAELHVPQFTS